MFSLITSNLLNSLRLDDQHYVNKVLKALKKEEES